MIGDAIGEGVQARKQLKAAKDALKDAKKDRERGIWMAQEQDYNPEYASDHIGPYTKAESPLADAFLGSFLTGDNASGIQGTRKGAAQQKAAADARSAQRFGSVDDLIAREKQVQKETPWEVKPFTREISKPDLSEDAYKASQLGYLSKEEMKALESAGFGFKDGRFREKESDKTARNLMHDLGLNTDLAGGEGQALLKGLAAEIAKGRDLKDIKKELQWRMAGVDAKATRDTSQEQTEREFVQRYARR